MRRTLAPKPDDDRVLIALVRAIAADEKDVIATLLKADPSLAYQSLAAGATRTSLPTSTLGPQVSFNVQAGSIVGVLRDFGTLRGGLRHYFFDFGGIARKALAQEFVACFGDEHIIFDTDA